MRPGAEVSIIESFSTEGETKESSPSGLSIEEDLEQAEE